MTKEGQLKKIKEADAAYYGTSAPIMSDLEYDVLRNDYIEQYGSADLDYVPGADTGAEKFRHPIPITSLGKIDESEPDKLLKALNDFYPSVLEPKEDGCTGVAYPVGDYGYKVVSRGVDGIEGEVLRPLCQAKAHFTSSYPIRFEITMSYTNFRKMNEELIDEDREPMKNPRNAIMGILRGENNASLVKYLVFHCYDVVGWDKGEGEKLDYIRQHCQDEIFQPVRSIKAPKKYLENQDTAAALLRDYYETLLQNYDFPIDGIVIKSLRDGTLKEFGSTAHHPNNARAWKPAQKAVRTTITGFTWQMGKSGKLTPVAEFEPVDIMGSTVSRASLANMNVINQLGGLRIGDIVGVIKAKMIIPQVVEVFEHGNGEAIQPPTECPFCHLPLEKRKINDTGEKEYRCTNTFCLERIAQRIAFIGSKKVLNINGLSEETAHKIVTAYQNESGDNRERVIFTLSEEDIAKLPSFAEKSAHKLYEAIHNATKHVDMAHFIKALCMDGIGLHVGQILQDKYGTPDALFTALFERPEEVAALEGIGPVTAESLESITFVDRFEDLRKFIHIEESKPVSTADGAFQGKIFVLTGKMPQPRSFYQKQIEEAGGKVTGSVSKKTDYLVIADPSSTSSKAEKARQLSTKLISPEELEHMLK